MFNNIICIIGYVSLTIVAIAVCVILILLSGAGIMLAYETLIYEKNILTKKKTKKLHILNEGK